MSGWLVGMGYADFAGSGVVHLLGGTCALVACYLIEPRAGRFDSEGRPKEMPGRVWNKKIIKKPNQTCDGLCTSTVAYKNMRI